MDGGMRGETALDGRQGGACSATRQAERMRSEGGPTGRQSESKDGGSVGTGPVLWFSLTTVPKARLRRRPTSRSLKKAERLPE